MKKKFLALSIPTLLFSLALCLGCAFLFPACGPKEDGTYMACHWAQCSVVATGAVLSVLSLVQMIFPQAIAKLAISVAMVPSTIVAMLLPNTIIHLCMMADMQCRKVMQPATIVISILLLLMECIDIIVFAKKRNG